MKRLIAVVLIAASLALSGCGFTFSLGGNAVQGSGNLSSESRPVSGFDQIVLNGSGDAQISQGDSESLKIEAEDNILPLITSEVQNGKLVIGLKNNTSISTLRGIRYTITVKSLKGLELNGSGNVTLGSLQADSLGLVIRGSGNVTTGTLQGKQLNVQSSGSGDFNINGGKVDSQSINMSGSGDFTAPDLESQSAAVTIAGSSSVTLWAKGTLNLSISGSGDVSYYGSPTVSKSISGSGSIANHGSK